MESWLRNINLVKLKMGNNKWKVGWRSRKDKSGWLLKININQVWGLLVTTFYSDEVTNLMPR